MINDKLLKNEERAVFSLRSLYRQYGYLPFKMSKFEEYELYIRNKDFLVSDRVITFNDTDGRLLALKPDVTLSIIRGGEDHPGFKQKVYYNENVYRISESTHHFKEIMQAGLECIGDIDLYDIYEVVSLAAESLNLISPDFMLDISHLGLLSQVLNHVCAESAFQESALRCISRKAGHELKRLCEKYRLDDHAYEALAVFVTAYGDRHRVLDTLQKTVSGGELEELKALSAMLDRLPYGERIHFDFSVVNDMSYYNGFVFKGFLEGICDGVLAGGQYDKMMQRMGRRSGAIGFALYLDLLEQLHPEKADYDVDALLLYDESCSITEVADTVNGLIQAGKTVSTQKTKPERIRSREIVDLRKGTEQC